MFLNRLRKKTTGLPEAPEVTAEPTLRGDDVAVENDQGLTAAAGPIAEGPIAGGPNDPAYRLQHLAEMIGRLIAEDLAAANVSQAENVSQDDFDWETSLDLDVYETPARSGRTCDKAMLPSDGSETDMNHFDLDAPEFTLNPEDTSWLKSGPDVKALLEQVAALKEQERLISAASRSKDRQIDDLRRARDRFLVGEAVNFALHGRVSSGRGFDNPHSRISRVIDRLLEVEASIGMMGSEGPQYADTVLGYIEDILWPDTASETGSPLSNALRFRLVESDARLAYLQELVISAIRENEHTRKGVAATEWFEKNGGYVLAMAQNTQLVGVMLEVMDRSEVLDQVPNERLIQFYLKSKDLPITLREVGKMTSKEILNISGIGSARLKAIIAQVEETGVLTPLTLNARVSKRCPSPRELALMSPEILLTSPSVDLDGFCAHRSASPQEILCEIAITALKSIDFSMTPKFSQGERKFQFDAFGAFISRIPHQR